MEMEPSQMRRPMYDPAELDTMLSNIRLSTMKVTICVSVVSNWMPEASRATQTMMRMRNSTRTPRVLRSAPSR